MRSPYTSSSVFLHQNVSSFRNGLGRMATPLITRETASGRQFSQEFRDRNDLDVVGGIGAQAVIDDDER